MPRPERVIGTTEVVTADATGVEASPSKAATRANRHGHRAGMVLPCGRRAGPHMPIAIGLLEPVIGGTYTPGQYATTRAGHRDN